MLIFLLLLLLLLILQVWEAAVDTSETGDLRNTKSMQDYHRRRDWSTFNSKVSSSSSSSSSK